MKTKGILHRYPNQDIQTKGELSIYHGDKVVFNCKTLELPWKDNKRNISCIPEGTYRVERYWHEFFGNCFWVKDVPGRTGILIHIGNYAGSINPKTKRSDIQGCILPGMKFVDIDGDGIEDVSSSGDAMRELNINIPDTMELVIRTQDTL